MPKKKANEATVEPSPVSIAATPAVKTPRKKAAAKPAAESTTKPVVARKKAAPKAAAPAPQGTALLPTVIEIWQIEELAYKSWLDRGCPVGSPDEDWYRAEQQLTARFALAVK